jgi:23S rRNA pseudouridine1911/1915/1917 synthase
VKAELVAGPGQAGERLDTVVGGLPHVGSRAHAQRLIDAGLVTVNGDLRPKRHRVAAGERIVARLEEQPLSPVQEVPYEVVLEDRDLLVVDKPAGVVVHPAPAHRGPTLAEALSRRGAAGGTDPERAGIVHRLDRDTSGLMLVARSEEAHRSLQDQLRRREVVREYLALVTGHPDAVEGTIDAALGRDRANRTLMSTHTDRPRRAVTHFRRVELLPRTALLELTLETGRTHQIRAHLAAIGHPVCGDAAYGGGDCGARLGLTRQFLHAWRVTFTHPGSGAQTKCESNLPVELCRALGAAKREPVSGGPDGG